MPLLRSYVAYVCAGAGGGGGAAGAGPRGATLHTRATLPTRATRPTRHVTRPGDPRARAGRPTRGRTRRPRPGPAIAHREKIPKSIRYTVDYILLNLKYYR